MSSIRRLYLYAVAFVSLEVTIWGTTGLLRSLASGGLGRENTSPFAASLAFVLVAAPVFALHWYLAQRSARRSPEERSARSRAVFLYGALLATTIPVLQNGLAWLSRALVEGYGGEPEAALLGGGQTAMDNLIAILVNALAAAAFYYVLTRDWQVFQESGEEEHGETLASPAFPETRRLYRYLWLLYALAYLVAGAQQLIAYLLQLPQPRAADISLLGNGLALLALGLPAWIIAQEQVRRSARSPAGRFSLIRLVVLYGLTFLATAAVLICLQIVVRTAIGALLGEPARYPVVFLHQVAGALSVGLPMGALWAYYGSRLLAETRAVPASRASSEVTVLGGAQLQQRIRLRRTYIYGLAFIGLVAATIGLLELLNFLMSLALRPGLLSDATLRRSLSSALATLLAGLPLWFFTWRAAGQEARRDGDLGDRARCSSLRRGYLFLVLFVAILAGMYSAGMLLYQLLQSALGQAPAASTYSLLQPARYLLVFLLLFLFHWTALRGDARLTGRSLARRYAQFPVLILLPGDSARDNPQQRPENTFADQMILALQERLPGMPVAAHPYPLGVPNEALSAARAVILPAELVARPSEAWRLWLQAYPGERVVIPTPTPGWQWVAGGRRSLHVLASQAADTIRRLAEGEEAAPPRESSLGMGVVYVFAALFALELVLALAAFLINLYL